MLGRVEDAAGAADLDAEEDAVPCGKGPLRPALLDATAFKHILEIVTARCGRGTLKGGEGALSGQQGARGGLVEGIVWIQGYAVLTFEAEGGREDDNGGGGGGCNDGDRIDQNVDSGHGEGGEDG